MIHDLTEQSSIFPPQDDITGVTNWLLDSTIIYLDLPYLSHIVYL